MQLKKVYNQSSQSAISNISFISMILVGCTSTSLASGIEEKNEIMNGIKFKSSSTRSNKKEIFSLSEIISNKKTLINLEKLEKGWNGYNAEPIDKEIIYSVLHLISDLDRQPKIFPTGRGTIQIEYSNQDDHLEIEISKHTNSFFEQKNQQDSEGIILIDKINEKVNEFFT
jgi:hypothetical protein